MSREGQGFMTPFRKGVFVAILAVGMLAGNASAVEQLSNGGFEAGETVDWTLLEGSLTGTGLGETPRSGSKSWHGAWNFAGAAQTTTYYQDVAVSPGDTLTASMWCKAAAFGGIFGNDTHFFRLRVSFRDASSELTAFEEISGDPDDTYQELRIEDIVAPAGTVTCRVAFSYITTQIANAWKVWNIDDVSLDLAPPTQHTITSISPVVIADNLSDTNATVTGTLLTGIDGTVDNEVKLVQGLTELVGTSVNVAGDGNSLTVTFPTTAAPFGLYDLVVEKSGNDTKTLTDAFTILDPSAPLLFNGDFEAGPVNAIPSGWTQWGSGNDQRVRDNTLLPWVFNPTPLVFEGANVYTEGTISGGSSAGIYQQVTLIPGLAYQLTGQRHYEDDGADGVTHEIGIFEGAVTGSLIQSVSGDLGADTVTSLGGGSGWTAVDLTFIPTQSVVTVYTKISATGGAGRANWFDDLALAEVPPCPNQHSVTNVTPDTIDASQVTQLTLTGSNLDQVDTVRLQNGGLILEGTIDSQSAGQILASFDPTGVPPEGLTVYDLVTTQTGCPTRLLPDAVTVSCLAPNDIAFASVSPSVFEKPVGTTQITVNGTNVASLNEVKLVYTPANRQPANDRPVYWQPEFEAIGTLIDASNPDAVVYEFDLLNGQAGMYKVVGTLGGPCESLEPAELLDVLELQLPTGPNLLLNASFEDATLDPWVATPDDGLTGKNEAKPGPELIFQSPPLINDACDDTTPIVDVDGWAGFVGSDGDYWVGTRSINLDFDNWITPNGGSLEQSVGLPLGPGNYSLTATVQVRMWDQTPAGTSVTLFFVVDGEDQPGATAALIDLPFMTVDGLDPYTILSADFIGEATSDITLKMQISTNADSGFQTCPDPKLSVVGIDDVQLVGVVACPTPFADADEDGDIDGTDFAILQLCIGDNPLPDECRCFDTDTSGGIDAADVADFVDCATGPGVLHVNNPNPNCIEQP